jgi:signal transduction histidine kinase
VELTIAPLRVKGNVHFNAFIHDITARQRIQQELEQTARSEREAHIQLKQAQSAIVQTEKLASLGQLVAGVAHEINNPLSFVSNNVAVLQRDLAALRMLIDLYRQAEPGIGQTQPELMGQIKELAERIDLNYTLSNLGELMVRSRDGLKRIQQIVKDLRDFARLDESDLQDVDLNAGVESTMNIMRGQAKSRKVDVELSLHPLPALTGYPAKLNQVILNLLSNAIDASPPGAKITIRTNASNEHVELSVIDRGSGIPPEVRERIFDPFFTTKKQGEGTGLGLSISYGIVRDHGGQIEVQSVVGQGSTFTVRLPRKSEKHAI